MPNNFSELQWLLERASDDSRNTLGEIIEAPFGNAPGLLCDHLCYLRAGAIGQLFDDRDYKQLVSDVADRVGIDWSSLVAHRSWDSLSAQDIEAAIAARVDLDAADVEDTESHIPEPFDFVLRSLLLQQVLGRVPVFSCAVPLLDDALDEVFSFLSTDWRKLLATILYVHYVVRPEANVA